MIANLSEELLFINKITVRYWAGRSAVDRLLCKQEASGSSPDRSIMKLPTSAYKMNDGFSHQICMQEFIKAERLGP